MARPPVLPRQHHRTVTLSPEPSSPARARQLLRQVLAEADRLDCLDAAELACTELVTNAVLHAHTPIDVTIEVADQVWVGVHDRNVSLPLRRHYDPQATTGRGLALVAALTDQYGVSGAGPDGKTVWFTVGAGQRERTEDELLMAWAAADWDVGSDATAVVPVTSTRTVLLLDLPSALWLAARQHHDALLRELALYVARNDDVVVDQVATDRARFLLSAAVVAAVEAQRRATTPTQHGSGALPWSPSPVDLTLEVPAGMARDFTVLQDTLDTAERLARAGLLLARPGLPEIVAVRDWACDQVVAQLAGIAPSRWPGAERTGAAPAGTDIDDDASVPAHLAAVRASDRRVAAGDELNRIVAVSEPLARALGWRVEDLVGRRIIALIPERLREAHVAGFTRHQSTGEVRVMDTPLTVPVLRADGSEVRCRLLIERAGTGPGAAYLAWIDPIEDDADGAPA